MHSKPEETIAEAGSALRRAAITGNVETLRQLVDSGVPVDTVDPNGWTALMLAAKYGNAETVHYLVKSGAEVNRRNKLNGTALHSAAQRGHAEVVRFLLNEGANVNERYDNGATPLITAAAHLEVLQVLVAAGADLNMADNWGNTALFYATMLRTTKCALFLLDKGAIIRLRRNPPTPDKQNPITWAKQRRQEKLVRRLEMAIVYDADE